MAINFTIPLQVPADITTNNNMTFSVNNDIESRVTSITSLSKTVTILFKKIDVFNLSKIKKAISSFNENDKKSHAEIAAEVAEQFYKTKESYFVDREAVETLNKGEIERAAKSYQLGGDSGVIRQFIEYGMMPEQDADKELITREAYYLYRIYNRAKAMEETFPDSMENRAIIAFLEQNNANGTIQFDPSFAVLSEYEDNIRYFRKMKVIIIITILLIGMGSLAGIGSLFNKEDYRAD